MYHVDVLIDSLSEHRRQLEQAISIVNGSQHFFRLSTLPLEVQLPGEEVLNADDCYQTAMAQIRPSFQAAICVTGRPFRTNWFSHEYRTLSVITVADWERLFSPPSARAYIIYQVAQGLCNFAAELTEDMIIRMVHEPPQGCMMDLCANKLDIRLGMVAGNLCRQCRGQLEQYGTNPEALEAVERILAAVRAESIGRPILQNYSAAFVVMRFTEHDENDNAYKHGIKPGLEDAGLTVIRADNRVESGQILSKVQRNIDRSRFVLVKVDEDNLNVYFELGLAMGADKDVLLISESSLVLHLPADLRNWECLTYPNGDYETHRKRIAQYYRDNYSLSP